MTDKHHAITTHAEHGIIPERMSPIVSAGMRILEANPDPAALRELLNIQRDWEHEEARKAFEQAMVRLKAAMPSVLRRDATVDYTSAKGRTHYTHTSLAAAMDTVTPHLTEHGFSISWTPATAQGQVSVSCILTHVGGHSKSTTINAPVDTSGNKSPAQGVASTITLLSRYTALALLGIATADMKEPAPAKPQPDARNPDRALKAVGELAKLGKTKSDAESFLGKPVQEWTNADIDKIAGWVKAREPAPELGHVQFGGCIATDGRT
jgi:hypothetical protein